MLADVWLTSGGWTFTLQVIPVPVSAVDKVVDDFELASGCLSVSPVVSVEPRVRKFHQPVTITVPLPANARRRQNKLSSLHLLCGMTGFTSHVSVSVTPSLAHSQLTISQTL